MLNYKCKSHRGRSPLNRTDALCIVEVKEKIVKSFARVIPDKKKETIIPIIVAQVLLNSVIYTDEHKSYKKLSSYNYVHGGCCHKYEFVNKITGENTQAVESFHNELKLEIKRRKGIQTSSRQKFFE